MRVHVQFNKFQKNCSFKKFHVEWYVHVQFFYGLNLITTSLIESIYIIKIPKIFLFTVETRANMSRFSTEGNNGSFTASIEDKNFLKFFPDELLLKFTFKNSGSTPLFGRLCHC